MIAIDFGTSNSTVGHVTPEGAQLIALEDAHTTIPSAIFFNIEENKVQFGREAVWAYTHHYEGRLMRSLKSVLGSSLIDEATQIGFEKVTFKDVIARFMLHLKKQAETHLGSAVNKVVLGRPVCFVDDDAELDRKAQAQLLEIARTCGFGEVHFQFEPIAAALDYESRVLGEELTLVADIGGGTSDFSIVRVSPQAHTRPDRRKDILANTGVHVGGTDYDRSLSLSQFMPHLGFRTRYREGRGQEMPHSPFFDLATWYRITLLYTARMQPFLREMHQFAQHPELLHRLLRVVREQAGHQLAADVESTKIRLACDDPVKLVLPYVDEALEMTIRRDEFESQSDDLTRKIHACIGECLQQAGCVADQIDTLFLTGGTTALPSVRQACVSAVPRATVVEGDKFGSVGMGLAIHAGLIGRHA